jgi:hypothetical protein
MSIETAEDRARQAYYRRYDQAVATLSPDHRNLANLHGYTEYKDGSWRITDALGNLVAEHRSAQSLEIEAAASDAVRKKQVQYRRGSISVLDLEPKTFGKVVAAIVREAVQAYIQPIAQAIVDLDSEKRIDAAVIDELGNCLERVDALEKSMSDGRVIRYMGRWCRDVDFLSGDMVSHGAALWIAKRPTRETPGTGVDWQKMLKADQRGGFKTGDDE